MGVIYLLFILTLYGTIYTSLMLLRIIKPTWNRIINMAFLMGFCIVLMAIGTGI